MSDSAAEPFAVRRFGDYELLTEIGWGGMGIVYKARQKSVNRLVALKMIRVGPFASSSEIKRFHTEAEAAAQLDHPNIVSIYEVGENEGQPFFTMKLVEGGSLAERIDEFGFTTVHLPAAGALSPEKSQIKNLKSKIDKAFVREREIRLASLIAKVARAVHHAHQHGILHRDLKPANILIDPLGEPHVTDFGLAKLLESESDLTISGAVLGTPNYIAPEQAAGKTRQLSTRSDVYSLGAILYHLLTGHPPFRAETPMQTLRQVVELDPARPSTINLRTNRDLETICLKCLEKEPQRRYHSAEALAEDLERWLRQEPIRARPTTAWEQTVKWVRRRPAIAAMLAGIVVTFLLGFAGVLWQWRRAESAFLQTTDALTQTQIRKAEDLFQAGQTASAMAQLARVLRDNPTNDVAAERLVSALTYRSFPVPLGKAITHSNDTLFAEFSSDGKWLVTASSDHTARVWDPATGQAVSAPMRHSSQVVLAHFEPGGKLVVTASVDGAARVWDAATGEPVTSVLQHQGPVWSAEFDPDGTRVITASADGTARIWNAKTGELVGEPLRHEAGVAAAQFHPDGNYVVTASEDRTARLWDAITGLPLSEPLHHEDSVIAARFSPNGKWLVTAAGAKVRISHGSNGALAHETIEHNAALAAVGFSPDSQRLVTASADGTARVWDAATGAPLTRPLAHASKVLDAQFGPNNQQILTRSADYQVRLWNSYSGEEISEPIRHDSWVWSARFHPDGGRIVTASKAAQVWDARNGAAFARRMHIAFEGATLARLSPDGKYVALAEKDMVYLGEPITDGSTHRQVKVNGIASGLEFSPDGTILLIMVGDQVELLNLPDFRRMADPLRHGGAIYSARFSPDGSRLVTASADHTSLIWEVKTGRRLLGPLSHRGAVRACDFSPDGRRVATGSDDGQARIWDARTGLLLASFDHPTAVTAAQFHPTEDWLLTAAGNRAQVWSAIDLKLLGEPMTHSSRVTAMAFSPDGRFVVTASRDDTARIWDAATGQPTAPAFEHDNDVTSAAFSPDSKRVATVSLDGRARIWDVRTGLPRGEWLKERGQPLTFTQFHPNSELLMTVSKPGVRMWDLPPPRGAGSDRLPNIVDAFLQETLNDQHTLEWIGPEPYTILKRQLPAETKESFARWVYWLFVDRGSARTVSPYTWVPQREFVHFLLNDNTLMGLREALRLEPTNGIAWARLGRMVLYQNPQENPRQLGEADWYTQRGWTLEATEGSWSRGVVLARLGNLEAARASIGNFLDNLATFTAHWVDAAYIFEQARYTNLNAEPYTKALEAALTRGSSYGREAPGLLRLRFEVGSLLNQFGIDHPATLRGALRLIQGYDEAGNTEHAAAFADSLFAKTHASPTAPPHLLHQLAIQTETLYAKLNLSEREKKFRAAAENIADSTPGEYAAVETQYATGTRIDNPSMYSRIYLRAFRANGSPRIDGARGDSGSHYLRTGPRLAIDADRDEFLLAWTSQPLGWSSEPIPADPILLNDVVFARRFQLRAFKPVEGPRGEEFQLTPPSTAPVRNTRRQIVTDLKFQPATQEWYGLLEIHGRHPLDNAEGGVGLVRLNAQSELLEPSTQARWDSETKTVLINEFTDRSEENGSIGINPTTGDYAITWMAHSQWYWGGLRQVFAKVFTADHQVKIPEFELVPPTVHRSHPRTLVDEKTGCWIFAYNYNFEGDWEIRGKVTDANLNAIGFESDLNVCNPPLDCDDAVRTPGEFRLTRRDVEGNLGPVEEIGRPFNLSYHAATGRLVLTYTQTSGTNPPMLFGKSFLMDLGARPPSLREAPAGSNAAPARLLIPNLASAPSVSQDLYQATGHLVLAWTEQEINGTKAYAAVLDPATWQTIAPKHRISLALDPDNQSAPFVSVDQRTGDYLIAWVSDVFPGPNTLIAGAVDGAGDAIVERGSTASDAMTFTLTSTAGANVVKFLGRLDNGDTREIPSTNRFSGLTAGIHIFRVSAVDRFGASDPTPAVFTWEILTPQAAAQALATRLQELVGDGVLSLNQAASLNVYLDTVVKHLDEKAVDLALLDLTGFLNQVRIFSQADILSPREGDELLRQGSKLRRAASQPRLTPE